MKTITMMCCLLIVGMIVTESTSKPAQYQTTTINPDYERICKDKYKYNPPTEEEMEKALKEKDEKTLKKVTEYNNCLKACARKYDG